MCGRYTVIDNDDIAELRQLVHGLRSHVSDDVFGITALPGTSAPILTQHGDFMSAEWGFRRQTDRKLVYNARSETLISSSFFSPHLTFGRCIIPAREYFEWQTDTENPVKKQKYRFFQGNGSLYFGGLFRPSDGGFEFTVITCAAAPDIAFIHNRMPLIFTPEYAAKWLSRQFDNTLLTRGIGKLRYEPVS